MSADAVRGMRRSKRHAKRPTRLRGWARRIAEARRRGHFTDSDKVRAGSFATCKVSEHRHLYTRCHLDLYDGPVYDLGLEFCGAVERDDIGRAQEIATKIDRLAPSERRASAR